MRLRLFPLLALAWPLGALAQEEPRPATLVTRGTAQVEVAPDEATVRLGVSAQRETAKEAQAEANATTARIRDALLAAGVPRERLQTSALSLSPVYAQEEPHRGAEPRIVAYLATNLVTVRLDDLGRIGPVVDAGLAAGANRVEGLSFGLRDDRPAREEALRRAAREAQAKAEALAAAMGLRLVRVIELREVGGGPMPFEASATLSEARALPATPVEAGQLRLSAEVTISYEIAP